MTIDPNISGPYRSERRTLGLLPQCPASTLKGGAGMKPTPEQLEDIMELLFELETEASMPESAEEAERLIANLKWRLNGVRT